MERSKKTLIIIIFGIFSAFILLMTTKDLAWFVDELFAIMVSILFFSPVASALIDGKQPRKWILVFILGGACFVAYMAYSFNNPVDIVEFFFIIVVVTSLSTIGKMIARKLEDLFSPE